MHGQEKYSQKLYTYMGVTVHSNIRVLPKAVYAIYSGMHETLRTIRHLMSNKI